MVCAPVWSSNSGPGGGDDDRDGHEREDRSGSDRERDDSYEDRDREERDIADRERDSSGPGSGDKAEIDDRDFDKSGSGGGDDKNGKDRDDDRSGSSRDDGEHRVRDGDGDWSGFAVWRNEHGDRVRSGEVIFLSSRRDSAARARAAGFQVIEEERLTALRVRVMRISVPSGRSEDEVIRGLHSVDPKGTATFNHIYEPAGPAIPVSASAISNQRIKPTKAKIGLVDAGVAAEHAMLARVTVTQRQFGEGGRRSDLHGTAVASRLAAAAPGASIWAANVFTTVLDGQDVASAYAIARGLDWLSRQQVAVINLSLAGPPNPVLEAIAKRMIAKGHILVAAVGNEGPRGAAQYPAAYDHVVGVTAVDARNRVYIYANQGEAVDFAALGVDAPVASSTAVEKVSGTSYAAPIVAAAFARRIAKPSPKQAQAALKALRKAARDLGAPGRDPVYGHGLIDVAR